jgi:hypothetical protein
MPIRVAQDGTPMVFDGPQAVNFLRMTMILRGMKLELRTGMRMTSRAPSCFTLARREYGLKGNKQKLIDQFEVLVNEENKKMEYTRDA